VRRPAHVGSESERAAQIVVVAVIATGNSIEHLVIIVVVLVEKPALLLLVAGNSHALMVNAHVGDALLVDEEIVDAC
jgi:hypothetical protein